MLMEDLIIFARNKGIDQRGKSATEIIREIQTREGNTPCFGINIICKYRKNCLWADRCLVHGHKLEIR
jgi:hypothetical protein